MSTPLRISILEIIFKFKKSEILIQIHSLLIYFYLLRLKIYTQKILRNSFNKDN